MAQVMARATGRLRSRLRPFCNWPAPVNIMVPQWGLGGLGDFIKKHGLGDRVCGGPQYLQWPATKLNCPAKR